MNDNARKWIAALRSGEFRQGRGQLRRDNSYCCLGVACELYRRENGGEWRHLGNGRFSFFDVAGLLPNEVQCWLGLRRCDGFYGGSSLVGGNDGGYSFAEIADLIESEPEGLFVESEPSE